jgi:hypothetical protein
MKPKEIFAIICLIILAGILGWFAYDYYFRDEPIDTNPAFGTPVQRPNLDRAYHNDILGFGFRYPDRYEITKEQLIDYSDIQDRRSNVLTLTLEDKTGLGQAKLTLFVNKEVAIERAERTMTLLQNDIGVYLADIFEDTSLNRDVVRTIGSIVMTDDNVYTWEYIFNKGKYDYGPELEAMLEMFGIYRTTEAGEEVEE